MQAPHTARGIELAGQYGSRAIAEINRALGYSHGKWGDDQAAYAVALAIRLARVAAHCALIARG